MNTLTVIFFTLLAIYALGFIVTYFLFMRERDSYFTAGKQRMVALFLGLMWPIILSTEISDRLRA